MWLTTEDRRLNPAMQAAIFDREERASVSAVTAWEYAELWCRGRLAGAVPLDQVLAAYDLDTVPLPADAWRQAMTLPDLHRDQIDRMLIAHAIVDRRAIVTADAVVRRYPVRCIG